MMDTRDLEMEVSQLHAEREGLAEELVDALALMPAETWSRRTCPRCEARRLVPEVSDDGTAWEGWICRACHGRWRFTVPLPAGLLRVAEERSSSPAERDALTDPPEDGDPEYEDDWAMRDQVMYDWAARAVHEGSGEPPPSDGVCCVCGCPCDEQDHDALTDPPEPGQSVAAYSESLGWCAGELYRDERVSVWHLATAQGAVPDPGDVTHWRPWPAAPGGER